jgi:hypothetical protein
VAPDSSAYPEIFSNSSNMKSEGISGIFHPKTALRECLSNITSHTTHLLQGPLFGPSNRRNEGSKKLIFVIQKRKVELAAPGFLAYPEIFSNSSNMKSEGISDIFHPKAALRECLSKLQQANLDRTIYDAVFFFPGKKTRTGKKKQSLITKI